VAAPLRDFFVFCMCVVACACARAANKLKEGVITTDSGLQYKYIEHGSGKFHPSVSSPCLCHVRALALVWQDIMPQCHLREGVVCHSPVHA
jgi:hypothetical protein